MTQWPPPGAEPVDPAGLYESLAEAGIEYGPAFQGLKAAWRDGQEVYAEIALSAAADRFGIHPALLDSALHTVPLLSEDDRVVLPFSWAGVELHASGATALRVRMTPSGQDRVAIHAVDGAGQPVVSIDALTLRPMAAGSLTRVDSLFQVEWTPVAVREDAARDMKVWRTEGDDVLSTLHPLLKAVQAETDTLAVVTRGAVSVAGEDVTDLAAPPRGAWCAAPSRRSRTGSSWSTWPVRTTRRTSPWPWRPESPRWPSGTGRSTSPGCGPRRSPSPSRRRSSATRY